VATTNCRDVTALVKPPRACFLNYPLGNSAGIAHDAANQRAILRAVLEWAPRCAQPGEILDLPFEWPQPGWEQAVERGYLDEPDVLIAQRRRNEFDAAGNHVAGELAREAATYCKDCMI
jgi:hypothetical protein